MDDLIPVINKVQDINRTVGLPLDLPRIAVVGSQSAGKSSVLESFVGRDFLPRGSGLCTRCPLVLQLLYDENREYAKFSHRDDEFIDFHRVREEIVRATDKLVKKNDIANTPINLKIYSPHVANLTLVDLPGLIQNPGRDQEATLPQNIRQMVKEYIQPPCCLILAISAANSDLATSEGIQLAKEVDPNGERTIGVLTKLDLMDKGTDARSIINNEDFPLKLGYVGVVNRSQKDIMDDVGMESARRHEQEFIEANYRGMDCMGTPYLQGRLTELLQNHIHRLLPQLRKQIQVKFKEYSEELEELEQYNSNRSQLMIQLLRSFSDKLKEDIEGVGQIVHTKTRTVGTRIKEVFHEWFPQQLKEIVVDDDEIKREMQNAIENISGNKTYVNPADAALKAVLANEIHKLLDPSLKALGIVTTLIQNAIEEDLEEFAQYRRLQCEVGDRMNEKVDDFAKQAEKQLRSQIKYHQDYINHKHEDFHLRRTQIEASKVGVFVKEAFRTLVPPVKYLDLLTQLAGVAMGEDQQEEDQKELSEPEHRTFDSRLRMGDLMNEMLSEVTGHAQNQLMSSISGYMNGENDDSQASRDQAPSGSNKESSEPEHRTFDTQPFMGDLMNETVSQVAGHAQNLMSGINGYMNGENDDSQASRDQAPSGSNQELPEESVHRPQADKSRKNAVGLHAYVKPYLKIMHKSQKDMLPKIIASEYIHKLTKYAETDLFILVQDVDKLMQEPSSKQKYREDIKEKVRALGEAKQAISDL